MSYLKGANRLQAGLSDDLLKRARIAAAHAGITLNDWVRSAIDDAAKRSEKEQGGAK
jgi:predicted HicB family RNase H-like nuclease